MPNESVHQLLQTFILCLNETKKDTFSEHFILFETLIKHDEISNILNENIIENILSLL